MPLLSSSARLALVLVLAVLSTALALPAGGEEAGPAEDGTAVSPGGPDVVAGAPLAPAGGTPDAVIRRTSFGIPHVVARDWTSLGFGHGYATAEDAICVLADTVLTGQGRRSRWLGPDVVYDDQVTLRATNLQVDTVVGSLRDRQVVEALLDDPVAGPSDRAKALVQGYADGVNAYLADVGGADGIDDPACAGAAWVQPATALDLWYGVYLANLLASTGVLLPQIADATPPTPTDPGTPVDPCVLGVPLPACEGAGEASAAEVEAARAELLRGLGRDPDRPFGSNGTALGRDATTTGRGMVLGNPHFPWRGRYSFHQAQLTIPGVYDVAGASLHGSPVINIGWNHDVAWTHTVSTAYRFTPYEYRLVPGAPTMVVTTAGVEPMHVDDVVVEVLAEDGSVEEVTRTLHRTDEGFVLDAPDLFMGWTYLGAWAIRDANAEHLRTIDAFLEMGEAGSVAELAASQDRTAGIPWVNTMAADRAGDALYADNSVVPHVTDEQITTCATLIGQVLLAVAGLPGLDGTRADGDCAWGADDDAARPGIFGPANLPDTTRSDWVVNANDSYWLPNPEEPLEGFDQIIGCERCERTLRTRMVYRYVLDRLAGTDGMGGEDRFTHEQLQAIEVENRVFAGELARAGDDLQTACAASGVRAEACEALAAWDGRDDAGSAGAILFREIWQRVPAEPWEVPFDAADPVATPRDLDEAADGVTQAIVDAVAALDEAGIPLDAPLGTQQVAADGPAGPGIAVGGGPGSTGNANALGFGDDTGVDVRYPVVYGSSHVQAVAFTDDGVDAATILTYGNAADPTSPHSTDQTRLWSAERWVDWPFTAAEQLADPGYRAHRVTADGSVDDLTPLSVALDPGRTDDPVAAPPLRVERVAGADRVATAVEVSRRTHAIADTAVLAVADDFPDALSGAPLATHLGGPLLLTGGDALDPRVAAELDRLGVASVVLLGGEVALGAAVADALVAAGLAVDRIAGPDRFATAAAVAARMGSGPLAFVADGGSFADAVSAAGVAAALGAPVVLTSDGGLPEPARAALADVADVVVAGGPAAVPDAVVAAVDGVAGTVVRAAGADRVATSRAVLDAGLARGLDPSAVWLADAGGFPDALAAGAAAGVLGSGVLLVGADAPSLADLDLLTVLVAGGPAVVPEEVLAALR